MKLTGRSDDEIALVEAYCKEQGLWRHAGDEPIFTSTLELDMSTVESSLAGPKRPQDRVELGQVPQAFQAAIELELNKKRKVHIRQSIIKDKPLK